MKTSSTTKLPKIYGISSCSEAADNIFAPSIFLFGCNLRCPYCLNSRLVVSQDNVPDVDEIPIDIVKEKIMPDDSEWVMVSGGEPLMGDVESIVALFEEIKSWGKRIGLSTNGTYPDKLEEVIHLVDYVTMDLKSDLESDYKKVYYKPNEIIDLTFNVFYRSMDILRDVYAQREDFSYEYRTTLYPDMVDSITIIELAKHIFSWEKWVLQQFRHAKYMLDQEEATSHKPYEKEKIDNLLSVAGRYVDNVTLRYV